MGVITEDSGEASRGWGPEGAAGVADVGLRDRRNGVRAAECGREVVPAERIGGRRLGPLEE